MLAIFAVFADWAVVAAAGKERFVELVVLGGGVKLFFSSKLRESKSADGTGNICCGPRVSNLATFEWVWGFTC